MNNTTILFVGLDTAKEYSEVAYSTEDRTYKPTLSGKIRTTKQGIEKLARQLQSKHPVLPCISSMKQARVGIGSIVC